jgi:hypothetical protein
MVLASGAAGCPAATLVNICLAPPKREYGLPLDVGKAIGYLEQGLAVLRNPSYAPVE